MFHYPWNASALPFIYLDFYSTLPTKQAQGGLEHVKNKLYVNLKLLKLKTLYNNKVLDP